MNNWWSQIKTAGSAIYANRRFLDLYKRMNPERLAKRRTEDNNSLCTIIGDVCIHPTATIHSTAVVRVNFQTSIEVQNSWNIRDHAV